jgi:hypothetical protein
VFESVDYFWLENTIGDRKPPFEEFKKRNTGFMCSGWNEELCG